MNALNVSAFFIKKGVTPLKLQKLLYYSQVWYFKKFNQLLFEDKIEGWMHGPVVRSIWENFRYIKRSDLIPSYRVNNTTIDYNTFIFLEEVWTAYGHLLGSELIDLTHQEKPWILSRQNIPNGDYGNNEVLINDFTLSDFKLDVFDKIPTAKRNYNSLGSFSNF
ncbi:Panacea domain-containing protein [Empedobacter brevis]